MLEVDVVLVGGRGSIEEVDRYERVSCWQRWEDPRKGPSGSLPLCFETYGKRPHQVQVKRDRPAPGEGPEKPDPVARLPHLAQVGALYAAHGRVRDRVLYSTVYRGCARGSWLRCGGKPGTFFTIKFCCCYSLLVGVRLLYEGEGRKHSCNFLSAPIIRGRGAVYRA